MNAVLLRAERAEAALADRARRSFRSGSEASRPTSTSGSKTSPSSSRAPSARRPSSRSTSPSTPRRHAAETAAAYESQLRDRARFIAALEKELVRREQLVKELVASVEERRGYARARAFEAAAAAAVTPSATTRPLRKKLDALAAEVARREGELTARGWRITRARRPAGLRGADSGGRAEVVNVEKTVLFSGPIRPAPRTRLDALRRQALAQEHAARVAAESRARSWLAHARAELAKSGRRSSRARSGRTTRESS